MRIRAVVYLVLAVIIGGWVAAPTAHAQSPSLRHESTFWVGGGVGLGAVPGAENADPDESRAGSLYASFQRGPHLVSARAATAGELFGDSFYDYGLLYGRVVAQSPLFVSLGAGLGYVDGTRSEGLFDDPEEVEATVGIPVEAQLYLRPFRFVGVGLYGFANFNQEEIFFGLTVSLQVGRLR